VLEGQAGVQSGLGLEETLDGAARCLTVPKPVKPRPLAVSCSTAAPKTPSTT